MAKGQTPALKPETAEKYREVVRLRAVGLTFDEIAERVGYASRAGAKEAYDAALRWWGRESVDQLREIEGERLEQLWRQTYGRVLQNPESTTEFVRLVAAAIAISRSRSALYGLEAPKQLEVGGLDGGPLQVEISARETLAEKFEAAERTARSVIEAMATEVEDDATRLRRAQ